MARSPEKSRFSEKSLEYYRNWNIGATAVTGAGIFLIPEAAPVFIGLTALNAVQALGAEVLRRSVKNRSSGGGAEVIPITKKSKSSPALKAA